MYTSPVRFEWDEAKRKANIAKHGIDFLDVPEMFGSVDSHYLCTKCKHT